MSGFQANFVLRVKETRGNLCLFVHNLKTGERKEFSTWRELLVWLENQINHQGLR
jgi:hypothetical protein